MPKTTNRTVYRVDNNNLFKFAALLNSGGVAKPWSNSAVQLLKSVVYAQTGSTKREISDIEASRFIERGYKLTG